MLSYNDCIREEGQREEMSVRQSDDPFDLQQFIDALAPIIEDVLAKLRPGRKRTRWMWFVFPRIAGLGSSAMAVRDAIGSPAEARAYLAHPVLGDRLRESVRLIAAAGRPLAEVFGHPDDMKFRSCVTLFGAVTRNEVVFVEALDRCCGGFHDPTTLEKLKTLGAKLTDTPVTVVAKERAGIPRLWFGACRLW